MATAFKFPDEQDRDPDLEIELEDNQHEEDKHNEVDESKITHAESPANKEATKCLE